MTRLGLVLLLLVPAAGAAAQVSGGAAATGDMAMEEDMIGGGSAARMRVPPTPPALTNARLEEALEATRGEIETCLGGTSASVRARISRDGEITLRIRERPSDAAVRECIDLAVRRRLVALVARSSVTRATRATVRFGRGGSTPPPPPPPLPSTGGVDEALVHARLDTASSAMMRCLADAAPGVVGTVTLTVHVRPDGAMSLEAVDMPSGVTAGPALVCLGDVISRVRVPASAGEADVRHTLALGR